MTQLLLKVGLALTPFVFIPGMDLRTPKEIFAFGVALGFSLLVISSGKMQPFKNKWGVAFLFFAFISAVFSTSFQEFKVCFLDGKQLMFLNYLNFWKYVRFENFANVLVYGLFIISVASVNLHGRRMARLLRIMQVCGFFMAVYMLLQFFGIDQFFKVVSKEQNLDLFMLRRPRMGGFIGQSTIAAPFVGMCVPFSLYFKKYKQALFMIAIVCLSISKMGIGSMIIGTTFYLWFSENRYHKAIATILVALLLSISVWFLIYNADKLDKKFSDYSSGRVLAWQLATEDFLEGYNGKQKSLIGYGPGSFAVSFPERNKSRFRQLHNEPLEVIYNFGIGGLFLLGMAGKELLKMINHKDPVTLALLSSLLIILLDSLGSFPFQIAPTYFYTAVIIGLLHNKALEAKCRA